MPHSIIGFDGSVSKRAGQRDRQKYDKDIDIAIRVIILFGCHLVYSMNESVCINTSTLLF